MEDVHKFLVCMIGFLAIVAIDAIAFIMGYIELPIFLVVMFASIALLFLPMLLFKDTQVTMSADGMEIKGPFLKENVTFDRINGIEFRESYKPGIKLYGYRGVKKCSGDFASEEFGLVRFTGDLSVPAFIFIATDDGIIAFNTKDASETRMIYESLRKYGNEGRSLIEGIDIEANRKRHRRIKRTTIGVIAALVIGVSILVLALLLYAHVNITLTDNGIDIDASMENEFIRYVDIKEIELRDGFDKGRKVMGYSGLIIDSGRFNNAEFGDYRLATHHDVEKYIVVEKTDGGHTVFNCGSAEETVSMYNEILARKGITSSLLSVPAGASEVLCYL